VSRTPGGVAVTYSWKRIARLRYKASRAHAPANISIPLPYCTPRTSYKAFGKTQPFLSSPRGSAHREPAQSTPDGTLTACPTPPYSTADGRSPLASAYLLDTGQCPCSQGAHAVAHARRTRQSEGERRRQALISTCLCVVKTIHFIAPKYAGTADPANRDEGSRRRALPHTYRECVRKSTNPILSAIDGGACRSQNE
jgi:hypothetical protein